MYVCMYVCVCVDVCDTTHQANLIECFKTKTNYVITISWF